MAEKGFKLSLNNHELAEEFFEGTRLLGIIAPIKGYHFCWQLKEVLGIEFGVNNDIEIQLKRKKRDYFFTVFEYCEPTGPLVHYIYSNHFDGEYLLPEFRHFDFLWLMKGDIVSDAILQQTIECIRTIHGVQLVTELTHEKIKNKEHMVF
jgi:hypothetical protein